MGLKKQTTNSTHFKLYELDAKKYIRVLIINHEFTKKKNKKNEPLSQMNFDSFNNNISL